MTKHFQSYVFNFSYSHMGGGLKRILAYLEWFNSHGGACFILNYRLRHLEKQFPSNHYCFLKPTPISRAFNFSKKLNHFISNVGPIELYYSYGIPLPYKPARVNWLHIANVLTLINPLPYVSLKRTLELKLLGFLIKTSIKHADVISAESEASLKLVRKNKGLQQVVSVNGSDEELAINSPPNVVQTSFQNIAVAVGTCQYKSIDDVYKIYLHLRQNNTSLRLIIIGIKKDVPNYITQDKLVTLTGLLPQTEVCNLLKTAEYYITSTLIENSYNAASEGAFLSQESFLSDIGPHRELLKDVKYNVLTKLGTRIPILQVRREHLQLNALKSWNQVIEEMIDVVTPNGSKKTILLNH